MTKYQGNTNIYREYPVKMVVANLNNYGISKVKSLFHLTVDELGLVNNMLGFLIFFFSFSSYFIVYSKHRDTVRLERAFIFL